MRTQEEIRSHYDATRDDDFLGFMAVVLVSHLDYGHCRDLLKDSVTEADWSAKPVDRESVLEEAREYMARIGWEKVEDHRGISTGRTCQKMSVWMWLLEEPHLAVLALDDGAYSPYGAPILKEICDYFSWPIPDSPEIANMVAGRPCGADYDCGCSP